MKKRDVVIVGLLIAGIAALVRTCPGTPTEVPKAATSAAPTTRSPARDRPPAQSGPAAVQPSPAAPTQTPNVIYLNTEPGPNDPVVVLTVKLVDKATGVPTTVPADWVDFNNRSPRCWRTEKPDVSTMRYTIPVEMTTDPAVNLGCIVPGYFIRYLPLSAVIPGKLGAPGVYETTVALERAESCVNKRRVVDATSGLPIPGARARVARLRKGEPEQELARADANGVILIPTGINHPRTELTAEGYLSREVSMDSRPEDDGDFALTPLRLAASLSVRVEPAWPARVPGEEKWLGVLRTGPPVGTADFAQAAPGWSAEALAEAVIRKGAKDRGRVGDWRWYSTESEWRYETLLPGDYLVVARDASVGCATRTLRLRPGANEAVVLRLSQGSRATLVGDVPTNGSLRLIPKGWGARGQVDATKGGLHVLPGEYDVELVLASGGVVPGGVFTAPEEGEGRVVVPDIPRLVAVTGRLLVDGVAASPAAGARVRVADGPWTKADEAGRFRLPDLAPGRYSLLIEGSSVQKPAKSSFSIVAEMREAEIDIGDFPVDRVLRR